MGMQTGRSIPEQSRVFDRPFTTQSSSPRNLDNQMMNNMNIGMVMKSANNMNENVQHHYLNEQRVRADHQMRVQQSYPSSQGQPLTYYENQNKIQNQLQLQYLNERNQFHQIGQINARNSESVPRSMNFGKSEIEREDEAFHVNGRNRRRGKSESQIQGLHRPECQIQGLLRPASFNYLLNSKGSISQVIENAIIPRSDSHSNSYSHSHSHFSGRDTFDQSGDECTQLSSKSGSSFLDYENNYSSCDGNLSHKSITSTDTNYLGILNHPNGEDYLSIEFGELGANSTSQLSISDGMTSYFDSPTNYGSSTPNISWLDYSFGKEFSRKLSKISIPSDNMTTNTTSSVEGNEDVSDFNYEVTQHKCESQSHVPANKRMIKAWLPLAFEGFDAKLIDSFICKLRDDGGFVTVQDLLDARASFELTRGILADIAGFKLGHYNRLERALSTFQ